MKRLLDLGFFLSFSNSSKTSLSNLLFSLSSNSSYSFLSDVGFSTPFQITVSISLRKSFQILSLFPSCLEKIHSRILLPETSNNRFLGYPTLSELKRSCILPSQMPSHSRSPDPRPSHSLRTESVLHPPFSNTIPQPLNRS